MFELFEKSLIPSYGSHSTRSQEGKDYIMPYLTDENWNITIKNSRKVGETSIPEDLFSAFIK